MSTDQTKTPKTIAIAGAARPFKMIRRVRRVPAPIHGESRTKQSFADECDINNVMRKYEKTGLWTHTARIAPSFGDFTEVTDYKSAVEHVMKAQEAFYELPARVREKFANNPAEFIEFAEDPKNAQALVAMGLATEAPQEPQKPSGEAPRASQKPSKGEGEA